MCVVVVLLWLQLVLKEGENLKKKRKNIKITMFIFHFVEDSHVGLIVNQLMCSQNQLAWLFFLLILLCYTQRNICVKHFQIHICFKVPLGISYTQRNICVNQFLGRVSEIWELGNVVTKHNLLPPP